MPIATIKFKIMLIGMLLSIGASGCSDIELSRRDVASASPPDYRKIVIRDLQASVGRKSPALTAGSTQAPNKSPQGSFLNAERFGRIEISELSQTVHNTIGLVWFACIRSYPPDRHPIDYAIFMSDVEVLDARSGIGPDKCGEKIYVPLIEMSQFKAKSAIY